MSEIDAIRALLSGEDQRPVGWAERRARIDEVGSACPVADDIRMMPSISAACAGEFSLAPGSDPANADVLPRRRLLLGLDREPPPFGDRGRACRARGIAASCLAERQQKPCEFLDRNG